MAAYNHSPGSSRGMPDREVAGQLFVSPRTIDFHLRNVFANLGINSRGELAPRGPRLTGPRRRPTTDGPDQPALGMSR